MKELWKLFWIFAKMGVMTFGGGYAMLPILQREVVETRGWTTEEELADYFAIGQCTPGIIAVIISMLAGLITNFSHLPWVENAFAGIQVCVCVLIFNATVKLLKKSVVDGCTAGIFLLVLAGSVVLNLSPVWFVLASALAGILLKNLEVRRV